MTRPRQMVLLSLAALVAAFAATWLTLPSKAGQQIDPPASLFSQGLSRKPCVRVIEKEASSTSFTVTWREAPARRLVCVQYSRVTVVTDVRALRSRVLVVFASAGAIVLLVGIAFGAGKRPSRPD